MDNYKKVAENLEKLFKSLKKDKADFIFLSQEDNSKITKKIFFIFSR